MRRFISAEEAERDPGTKRLLALLVESYRVFLTFAGKAPAGRIWIVRVRLTLDPAHKTHGLWSSLEIEAGTWEDVVREDPEFGPEAQARAAQMVGIEPVAILVDAGEGLMAFLGVIDRQRKGTTS